MKTRIITAVIFTAAVLLFLLPAFVWPGLPVVFFALTAAAAALELQQALLKKVRSLNIMTMAGGSLIMLTPLLVWAGYRSLRPGWQLLLADELPLDPAWKTDLIWLASQALSAVLIFSLIFSFTVVIMNILRRGPESLPAAMAEITPVFYIAWPFSVIPILMFAVPNGYRWMLLAVFLPWVSDVSAYFAGSFLGKTKILPQISPNKTLEGFIGGLAGSMVFSALYFLLFMQGDTPMKESRLENMLFGLAAGLVLSFVSQLGDWLASGIKRWVRIKDFSHLLPGHGGVLDRFDSVLLTLPAAMVLVLFYYLI